jgi:CRISPR/Cas system CSM-associated protein Csm3 (group 7 of RAMP superfamily)
MTPTHLQLRFTLLSDATFGRGDGVAGLVDEEIEHDTLTGLPYLRGRTLKGLLVEECANILYALQRNPAYDALCQAARDLFGNPGSTLDDDGLLHIGHAQLPQTLRDAIATDVEAGRLSANDILESLTAIRRQTAIDDSGAPERESLRAMRVLLRDLPLQADLTSEALISDHHRALLVACALGLRRAGIGRNRGRGRLGKMQLHDLLITEGETEITQKAFDKFATLVKGQQG